MEVTILGCGTSGGVPRIGNDWGACDPDEPKNRRRRCSILVKEKGTTVLIDTSPDIREQLLEADIGRLDGVVWTHEHADQCHGIDELRVLAIRNRERVNVWGDKKTLDILIRRFDYCFRQLEGNPYPAILDEHLISGPFTIGDINFLPFDQDHGSITSLGFRMGPIGYSNDLVNLDDRGFEILEGVDTWIVDAMRYTPHPTHVNLETALKWIERLKPRRAILTNMHVDLDYQTLRRELPDGVEPGYDGMVIEAE
ncbi:MBL fold metallo-hydrolase [uncultured Sneathiella sp.]|uniref:MBL fold metallo-hydrolase n=1 Tax=uncultured Sneathiella sp. TaxID=879315 RepID=UPI0030ED8709|tara:strand:+ start:43312 stop:44073 length:762 start_codon:yes stop_codon:yes gene_type:complete